MKVKVYAEQTGGLFPRYGLNGSRGERNAFCDVVEVDLPESYIIVERGGGERRIRDPDGFVCGLVTDKDHGFWICPFPTEGVSASANGIGLYIRVNGDLHEASAFRIKDGAGTNGRERG